MRTLQLGLLFLGFLASPPSAALANCQCRAGGLEYELGQVACLRLPEGDRLARCSMVLNNSSWTKMSEACPTSFNDHQDAVPHSHSHDGSLMSVAAALHEHTAHTHEYTVRN